MQFKPLQKIDRLPIFDIKISTIGFSRILTDQFIKLFIPSPKCSLSLITSDIVCIKTTVFEQNNKTVVLSFMECDSNERFNSFRFEIFNESDGVVVVIDSSKKGLTAFRSVFAQIEKIKTVGLKKVLIIFTVN